MSLTERVLITGSAGFIGSSLGERLLREGKRVRGIDCLTDYYSIDQKKANLAILKHYPSFEFVEKDLNDVEMGDLLKGVDLVYHLAAQPGVRASWDQFDTYVRHNIMATSRLLAALEVMCPHIPVVYASSSSVYGNTKEIPFRESQRCSPFSPYGVTKLAAENLVSLYSTNYGLKTVSLRYFTVFGPRQRPDMAFHKFLLSVLKDKPVPLYGDGRQTRDFTFISDVVEACVRSPQAPSGSVINVGGGSRCSLKDLLEHILPRVTERKIRIEVISPQAGDVSDTLADLEQASKYLDYQPKVGLCEGLKEEWDWICRFYH
ncbi:MAG: GDP-mannose 4,6-dehydratase [Synergistales bacterium]|nr:GDP-mannose 4,6-dehydratase [Synergistales bacterium]